MIKNLLTIVAMVFCFINAAQALAENGKIIATSGTGKVSLLELYSSQSCSSCPPADQWISKLESHDGLWLKFVPVVFHVDYWNHLNWKDEFSSADMTARQIAISKTWARPAVYTPAVLWNGSEWRTWQESPITDRLLDERSKINLIIIQNSAGLFSVKVTGQEPRAKYVIHLAKLGVGISSKINDGENSGKTLVHNFVVLDWKNQTLGSTMAMNPTKFKAVNKQAAKKYAVVAWIEEVGRYRALQATGAYL